jgi:hypothetical protein
MLKKGLRKTHAHVSSGWINLGVLSIDHLISTAKHLHLGSVSSKRIHEKARERERGERNQLDRVRRRGLRTEAMLRARHARTARRVPCVQ